MVTFTDPAGVRRKRSAATLAEARVLKSSLAADVARGEYREQSRTRFAEYAAEWVRTFHGRTARGTRTVPLMRTMADDLANYRSETPRLAEGDLALPTRTGTHILSSNLSHWLIKPPTVAAGVPWATAR